MSPGPEQSLLQVLPKAIVDRERNNQRSYTGRDTSNRNAGNDADKSLASFRSEIAGCDEEFEAHGKKLSALSCQHSAKADYSWPGGEILGMIAGTRVRYAR